MRRNSQKGQHRRPSKLKQAVAVAAPVAAAGAGLPLALAAASGSAAAATAASHAVAHTELTAVAFPSKAASETHLTRAAAPQRAAHPARWYSVRAGDSLSSIAASQCGKPADWSGIYHTNRRTIGANPNLILVGQNLKMGCYDPPVALTDGDGDHDEDNGDASSAPAPVKQTPVQQAPVQSAPVSYAGGIWGCIADHESGNDWSIDTGNGFYGGLQFTEQTWLGFGGGAYAQYANEASPAEQIAIAQKVLAVQGWGAWPVTSRECGV